ncbi:hypothetical protein K458DRAFT_322826 [Lentithecium fluviatile CBS 122367]|uniref:Rhodopsin domain-containing protein n=1 Tax=Lentithecium fluviatile CBS 122367 TaxID=1168545 RepID=A0A6G1IDV0_9PLEO|nr:hypothetical protein K458DRAFT_322826 [Lentithecium fluviatile CBS 122367]
MKGRGGEVMAVAVLFFVLTWLTVSLRVYVRGVVLKTWGKDDTAMFVTVLIFTVYLAFQMVAVVFGTGQHRWELRDKDAQIALLFWYLCELLYVLSNCTLKIALGIFYLRVALQRWHIWCIKLLMVGTVLFGLTYFFLVMLQCIPVSEFWLNHPASSKCIPESPTTGITYALGAVNAFADWSFGTLPIFIVWDLQMNRKTKIMVVAILAFASIGSTATVVRMQYIHSLTEGPDFLYATVDVALWSTVEPGIGITAGCIATLRPLLQNLLWRFSLASAPSSSRRARAYTSNYQRRRNRQCGYSNSLDAHDLVPPEGSTSTTITGPKRLKKSWIGGGNSQEVTEDTEMMGIQQSVVVKQEIEGPPQLNLRESLRYSFTRGTMLSPKHQKSSDG